MSRTKTILLSLTLIIVLAITSAGLWWWKNGDDFLVGLKVQSKEKFEEGQRTGRGSNPADCLQNAVGRAENCPSNGLLCEANARIFMKGCLSESRTFTQFCEGLPPYEERIARINWAIEACARLGKPSERCGRVVNEASVLCAQRKEKFQ